MCFIPGSTTTPYFAVTPWTLLAVRADAGSSGIIQRLYFPAIVFWPTIGPNGTIRGAFLIQDSIR